MSDESQRQGQPWIRRGLYAFAAAAVATTVLLIAQGQAPAARFVRAVPWTGRGLWLAADTHVHTKFSDGNRTVAEVVEKAASFGCQAVGITDHSDKDLKGATPEFVEAIQQARAANPGLVVLAGLEWNVPPWGGDEHAVVLLPQSADEARLLGAFKDRFDDYQTSRHDPKIADEGLRWLAANAATNDVPPVVVYDHPSRKDAKSIENVPDMRQWRAVNDLVIGFEGGPGHQGAKPLGSYEYQEHLIDRWDPAVARVGDAWDTLLQGGMNVWGAYAVSDFHDPSVSGLHDYWPCEFAETWVYAPEATAAGVLRAFRAGSFFGVHGHIAREVALQVSTPGLSRPAGAGETVEVSRGAVLTVRLSLKVPDKDWALAPNRLDRVDLIAIQTGKTAVVASVDSPASGVVNFGTFAAPPGGVVFRAVGRRHVPDSPDLTFYTNPVRAVVRGSPPDPR